MPGDAWLTKKSPEVQARIQRYVIAPAIVIALVLLVSTLGYAGFSALSGGDGEDVDPRDAGSYGFDETYVPTELGTATGEARFVDDAASAGITSTNGGSGLIALGNEICLDLNVNPSQSAAAAQLAERLGSSLRNAHLLVLSADYNLC